MFSKMISYKLVLTEQQREILGYNIIIKNESNLIINKVQNFAKQEQLTQDTPNSLTTSESKNESKRDRRI